MTFRWRPFGFAIIALILVGTIERLSSHVDVSDRQAGPENPSSPEKTETEAVKKAKQSAALIVPLYAVGDLLIVPEKKPRRPDERETKTSPVRRDAPQSDVLFSPGAGDRPVLEVDYRGIGFEQYLDAVERVGRLFIVLRDGEKVGLGPQVSLKDGSIRAHGTDLSLLAAERPHLVSDTLIETRLASLNLPHNALPDSVVLFFTRPFDALLWDTITDTLSKQDLRLDRIQRITGAYVSHDGGMFLRLDRAYAKDGNRAVRLGRELQVSL